MKKKVATKPKEVFMYSATVSGDAESFSLHKTYKEACDNAECSILDGGCRGMVIYKAVEIITAKLIKEKL